VRRTRERSPFHIDAWVVLPDHMQPAAIRPMPPPGAVEQRRPQYRPHAVAVNDENSRLVASWQTSRFALGSSRRPIAAAGKREPGMTNEKLFAALILAGVLGACGKSTGILPAGPNTYAITEDVADFRGGSMEAQRVTLAKANAHCKSQGREMLPLDLRELGKPPAQTGSNTGYSATFRCLLPSDPEFKR